MFAIDQRSPSGRSIIRQKPPVMQYVPKQRLDNDAQKKDAVSVLKDTDIATKSKRISASVSPVTMAVHKSREDQTSVQRQSNLDGNKTETLRQVVYTWTVSPVGEMRSSNAEAFKVSTEDSHVSETPNEVEISLLAAREAYRVANQEW